MSLEIERSIDIEDAVRIALQDYLTVYCRPLPAAFSRPCILVTQVGGSDSNKIDNFEVVLDSRADNEAEALEYLRNAVGILKASICDSATPIRYVTVNSSGSWGADPVRPELAMCSARLTITAHLENATIE